MKRIRVNTKLKQMLSASVIVLLSPWAFGDEPKSNERLDASSGNTSDVIRVTARNQKVEAIAPDIELDAAETFERLQRQLAEELAKDLKDMSKSRIEFVIAEVPTRG